MGGEFHIFASSSHMGGRLWQLPLKGEKKWKLRPRFLGDGGAGGGCRTPQGWRTGRLEMRGETDEKTVTYESHTPRTSACVVEAAIVFPSFSLASSKLMRLWKKLHILPECPDAEFSFHLLLDGPDAEDMFYGAANTNTFNLGLQPRSWTRRYLYGEIRVSTSRLYVIAERWCARTRPKSRLSLPVCHLSLSYNCPTGKSGPSEGKIMVWAGGPL